MRNKLGAASMVLGLLLILASLALLLYNRREAEEAGESAASMLPQLVEQIQAKGNTLASPEWSELAAEAGYIDPSMTEVEIDGKLYIGYIELETLDIQLPVLSQWSYFLLKLGPCRYSGSTKTGNLVLMAHNYINYFGRIKDLNIGDRVRFTDMDGVVTEYQVAVIETLPPTAVKDMTVGEYALTLFTCTYGGQTRVTVRCERVTQ